LHFERLKVQFASLNIIYFAQKYRIYYNAKTAGLQRKISRRCTNDFKEKQRGAVTIAADPRKEETMLFLRSRFIKSLIENAGMLLTDDELEMVSGGMSEAQLCYKNPSIPLFN
jgi:hypothetical protein